MAEPDDMIMPMLREMRAESRKDSAEIKRRIDKLEEGQKSIRQALGADSFMGRLIVGDWEERIEALEAKVKKLEARK